MKREDGFDTLPFACLWCDSSTAFRPRFCDQQIYKSKPLSLRDRFGAQGLLHILLRCVCRHAIEPILHPRSIYFRLQMLVGGNLDEDQDCNIVPSAYFGRQSNVIERVNELRELSFCFCFPCRCETVINYVVHATCN